MKMQKLSLEMWLFPSGTTYSIPESLGIVIKTDEGNIVYTGGFLLDQSASQSYATDFGRLAEIDGRCNSSP